jgi:hypothetical protein
VTKFFFIAAPNSLHATIVDSGGAASTGGVFLGHSDEDEDIYLVGRLLGRK